MQRAAAGLQEDLSKSAVMNFHVAQGSVVFVKDPLSDLTGSHTQLFFCSNERCLRCEAASTAEPDEVSFRKVKISR